MNQERVFVTLLALLMFTSSLSMCGIEIAKTLTSKNLWEICRVFFLLVCMPEATSIIYMRNTCSLGKICRCIHMCVGIHMY